MRMLRVSMCAMKRSEKSGWLWSRRTISLFGMRSMLTAAMARAVLMRAG